jgi:hypothetical protein
MDNQFKYPGLSQSVQTCTSAHPVSSISHLKLTIHLHLVTGDVYVELRHHQPPPPQDAIFNNAQGSFTIRR